MRTFVINFIFKIDFAKSFSIPKKIIICVDLSV